MEGIYTGNLFPQGRNEREEKTSKLLAIAEEYGMGEAGFVSDEIKRNVIESLVDNDSLTISLNSLYNGLRFMKPNGAVIHEIPSIMGVAKGYREYIEDGRFSNDPMIMAEKTPEDFVSIFREMCRVRRDCKINFL